MNRLSIPRDALVLVGDGQKGLFLRNIGDEKFPNLTTERVFTDMNPPTREQGTDRPGRGVESAGGPRRSGMEMTVGTSWRSIALSTVWRQLWSTWSAQKT